MRVLIVDDEPVILRGLVKMVERYPGPITAIDTADDGETAYEAIRKSEPHIVMTDLRMKRMDGLELCELIHKHYGHIQVAVISGYNDFGYAQRAMAYGVKRYVLKPATQKDSHEVLHELLLSSIGGYVPVQKYVEWVDKLEESIWTLQSDELTRRLEEGEQSGMFSTLNLIQLNELLEDCLNMIVSRLRQRNWPLQTSGITQGGFHTKSEVMDAFTGRVLQILDELRLTRKGNFKDPMEEAKAYIDKHLSEEITLEEVARKVGLTRTYFSALFKKMTGETFVHYRIKKRMEKACQLLAVPNRTISDIAVEVGYEDYPHFTKTFKNVTGFTQSEYRASLGIL
jgi:two-component system, response regulator YesN